jgi:hypothetical protein
MFALLRDAMRAQDKACRNKLPWVKGTNLESYLEEGDEDRKINSVFIADITILNLVNHPLIIVEVAYGQSRAKALAKVTERMIKNPTLLGAVVITVDESPVFSKFTDKASRDDHIPDDFWVAASQNDDTPYGPIEYNGRTWIGSITCSFDISIKGEADLWVQKAVSQFVPITL